jgi:hypothetical protein
VRRGNEARWALGIRMSRRDIAIRNKKQRKGNKEGKENVQCSGRDVIKDSKDSTAVARKTPILFR